MKRNSLLLLILLYCSGFRAFGQHVGYTFGHSIDFQFFSTDRRAMYRSPSVYAANDNDVSAVFDYSKNNVYGPQTDKEPKTPMLLGVKLNPGLKDYLGADVASFSKFYQSYIISDSSDAILIALGITPENGVNYLYHVVENDEKELVHWNMVTQMERRYGAKKPYAFLGRYNAPGKKIMVEVVDRRDYRIRDGVIFDWTKSFKPIVTQLTVAIGETFFNVAYEKRSHGYASRFDTVTHMPLDLKLPADSSIYITLDFKNHETVPYECLLIRDITGKKDTIHLEYAIYGNNFLRSNEQFNKPGKYELIIQRVAAYQLNYWDDQQVFRLPFEVIPPPLLEKKISVKTIGSISIATLAGVAILFFLYRRRYDRKLQKETQARQAASRQLRAVRAQLNPHFIFNALSSIQNLMNKKEVDSANHYLVKFASLTRKVLDSAEQELIPVEDELQALDDYLQMEQLRFRFQYSIDVDESVNRANTEIPAMLLQPFVENAVIHAVSALHEKGAIIIGIHRQGKGLILSVIDNGPGFGKGTGGPMADDGIKPGSPGKNSLGIKLSRERIALLNELYKERTASLDIHAGDTGTEVTIQLNNWI